MTLDLVALVLLLGFAAVGAARGALASGLALAALALAWAVSVCLGPFLVAPLATSLGISRWIAAPVAGTAVFMGAYLLASAGAFVVRAVERERRNGAPRTSRDRLGGALFGMVRGFAVVIFVGWLALCVDALRVVGAASWAPDVQSSTVAQVTRVAVDAGVRASLGGNGPETRAAARAASNPARALADVRSVVTDPHMEALRDDSGFWSLVENGDVAGAERTASFTAIAYDSHLRGRLHDLGMISEQAAGNPILFQHEVAGVLRQLGPKLHALRTDPELAELRRDPQVQRMAGAGDTLGLLENARVRRLIDHVLSESPPSGSHAKEN